MQAYPYASMHTYMPIYIYLYFDIEEYPLLLTHSIYTLVAGTCDFDNDFCGWSQDTFEDEFDWSIAGRDGTATEDTGPKSHHGKSKEGTF